MSLIDRTLVIASQRFPRLSRHVLASSGYTLDPASFGPDAFRVWDASTAARQDRAWRPLVQQAIAGSPRADIAALFRALDEVAPGSASLLEVGCGGGYNSDLVAHHEPALAYSGVDISPAMVTVALSTHPGRSFVVASATALPFADSSFDIVMDGVALIHIPAWREALGEYARVSRRWVLLHALSITEGPTTEFAKYAYGQPSREFVFNREELLSRCVAAGMSLRSTYPADDYDLEPYLGIPSVSETWVLER